MYRMRRRRKLWTLLSQGPGSGANNRRLLALFFFLICIAASVYVLSIKLRPVITQVAASEAGDVVTAILNDAVTEMIQAGEMEYEDLVTLEKDAEGRITALTTNMAKVNLLQAELSSSILDKLYALNETVVEIPLGNLLGSTLFSGYGPNIPIKIVSITSVYTDFSNEFSSAGINQTRHMILLDVSVELEILLPGYTDVMDVGTQINVAETVIVGDVPDSYADFSRQNA